VQRVELPVGGQAGGLQVLLQRAALTGERDEVQVLPAAGQRRAGRRRALEGDADAAERAERDPARVPAVDQGTGLIEQP
jgi:hypothetical protein